MDVMLKEGDAEAAGYFLQQSLEKHLKAFLLQRGWGLRKIHELDALLNEALPYEPRLESFRDLCERVSGYYFTERYPRIVEAALTRGDIEKDKREARRFRRFLTEKRIASGRKRKA